MSQNPPKILEKCAKNHRKSRFRGVRGALGRGLGAMVAPRGAQEPKNIQKPRSRSTLGPSCGSPFSALFAIFRVFFVDFFPDIFVMVFYRFQTSPDLKNSGFALVKQCFSEKRRSRPGSHFGINLAPFWEALGHQNREKRVPESTPEKGSPKSHAGVYGMAQDGTEKGEGGALYRGLLQTHFAIMDTPLVLCEARWRTI